MRPLLFILLILFSAHSFAEDEKFTLQPNWLTPFESSIRAQGMEAHFLTLRAFEKAGLTRGARQIEIGEAQECGFDLETLKETSDCESYAFRYSIRMQESSGAEIEIQTLGDIRLQKSTRNILAISEFSVRTIPK